MKLLDMERRMDATLDRKKLDIQETLNQPDKVTGTLRMYIFNTHANQAQSEASEHPAANAPPFW
jgi:SWI/SNF-related matrix-associated actin-dependent regulator of chromatin subfamily D